MSALSFKIGEIFIKNMTTLSALLFRISIIDLLYNNKMVLYIITFYKRAYGQIAVPPDLEERPLIKIIFKL